MMYISGRIETVERHTVGNSAKCYNCAHGLHMACFYPECGCCGNDVVETRYVCTIKTPGMQVMKSSVRSREEALTEVLKYIGLPL